MRMSEGVEWALHTCLNLTWLPGDQAVPTAKLAAFYALPAAYLNKQMQALARAGIVSSTPGPRGGFRLARSPEQITVLDIVVAIEGPDEAFRCVQLLKQGPGADPAVDYRQACLISQAMHRADMAWRRELAAQTLAGLKADVEQQYPAAPGNTSSALRA
ncbi:RrF2 family transcriptional regulator [Actinoplanes aureus]|uniref:Rrf2 family transcriptional regulator n=1 Tax=Actinoplanes aureus TaxID=2792083 RepID=A0A931G766_9ACTN|nr:Rrf2 family transcriptional regulator [Actinoplanes aureus]MBG0567929.1 Rrf2 family transcriptional regulator [Actinoplanes aureus]